MLLDVAPSQIEFPLAQFQHTRTEKEDFFQLLTSINSALEQQKLTDQQLRVSFDMWWPKLEEKLQNLPSETPAIVPSRTDRDILEEILEVIRGTGRARAAFGAGEIFQKRLLAFTKETLDKFDGIGKYEIMLNPTRDVLFLTLNGEQMAVRVSENDPFESIQQRVKNAISFLIETTRKNKQDARSAAVRAAAYNTDTSVMLGQSPNESS